MSHVPHTFLYRQLCILLGILFDGDLIIDIRLPAHVILEVQHTEPGEKGNTATGATKPATVETDYVVNVPLFINS